MIKDPKQKTPTALIAIGIVAFIYSVYLIVKALNQPTPPPIDKELLWHQMQQDTAHDSTLKNH